MRNRGEPSHSRSPDHHDRVAAWAQQVRHARALGVVLRDFADANIPALPVKGIVSAHVLYDDIAARLLTDVDVRIRPRDFDRVVALAARRGRRIIQRMHAYANVVFVVDGVCIDVEGYPSVPGLSRLTVETMLERARPSSVLGFPHLLPDFDDHAVLLLLNAFKDKLTYAFAWSVRDLERIPLHRDFDPDRLVARLREAGAMTIGWVVADWMIETRRVALWREVRDRIGPRPPRRGYATLLEWAREHRLGAGLPLRLLTRMGADRASDQARAFLRMAWWQAEAWASQWGDTPFHRNDPATIQGTVSNESTKK